MAKATGMVNITDKPPVYREATASGSIRLRDTTVMAIQSGTVKKGDVLTTARLAAILAVKETPRLIPMCHPISITGIEVVFDVVQDVISAKVTVTTVGKTGVEMEALAGVAAALLNIWDMVKYLEKDATGNYPHTRINNISVLEKIKKSD
jgi:cyclic pyranopterin phosphate synthase